MVPILEHANFEEDGLDDKDWDFIENGKYFRIADNIDWIRVSVEV